ncbi:alpha/beta fold hydrolase [Achromobacter sp.]|uniref:alpha/beta fold hydrolase n=1 Tax=Achromobacter sp. TaxID=134375 RepID=UPI003C73B7DA
MPTALTHDGYRLHMEEAGQGSPVVFVHEFAGNHLSWEPQLHAFARRHRCIAYAARGYPPSDVPGDPAAYSQENAVCDIASVLTAAGIDQAHIVGLSMGGFAALHFGLAYPERARSLTIAGAGYGALTPDHAAFREASLQAAERFEALGSAGYGPTYAAGAARVQYQNKDPRGWQAFADALSRHDAAGAALTLRGVQGGRPALDTLAGPLRGLNVPALIIAGDEDDHALEPALFLKRVLPCSGLLVLPKTGHTLNLEEPEAFNRAVLDFIAMVEAGRWTARDPRASGEAMKLA